MKQFDAIVIGAGISGLSFANYAAAAGLNTLVLEKSGRVGGCFHSHRFDGEAAGFWLELGAHTCYNSYQGLIGLMEQHGMMGSILSREKVSFKMLVDNEIKSITSQLSFPELFGSAWRIFTLKKEGESVASYYGRIVGRKNYDRVFAPAFNAVISQRANDFPADMLFNKRPRRKDVIKSFTLQGGLNTVIDRLSTTAGITVLTGADVVRVARGGKGYTVELAGGEGFEAPRLVLATPPPAAAKLAGEISPELSRLFSQVKVENIETVGVAVKKEKLSLPPLAGIIPIGENFYSAVSRDTVPHESYRGFSFHFKSGGFPLEAKLKRVAAVLRVNTADLEQVVQRESQLPSPVVGHKALTDQIDSIISGEQLFVTGNYFAGMAIEDCIVRSRKEYERFSAAL
ncbi:Protoporphyrinogen IX oxidase, aerobic, HemY [Citrifermentans bremense]|uniref:Protoporphyrinogen IX oxidase, aerobic, HemY n=1 Tax=Citrifermentans bremense TaxID=60035 RepID=A0A6S6LZS8_9BACT|nr:FAD-dependent oxidoreductase [Citrifermentans bremense]BCG45456.1 Protoporphyrinogen IX oxidase, aerobic, HemY [Citrifermentans bremense]